MTTPTFIARYEITGYLKRGGMGSVFLARDPNIERTVVIKLLNGDLEQADARARFAREARAAGALNHPNVVTIFDYGSFEDAPYLVMEHIRGETLADAIARRAPYTLADKLRWLEQLCAALDYAHNAGIIHRDIKPSNLMIDEHGVLKVLDFGVARLRSAGVTTSKSTIGTPGYMAPEQISGKPVDRFSDVFSVGAVAYELITYTPAFVTDSPITTMNNVMRTEAASIEFMAPGVSPALAAVVRRALEKNSAVRYQDAGSLRRDFEAARRALGTYDAPPGPAPEAPPSDVATATRPRASDSGEQRATQRALARIAVQRGRRSLSIGDREQARLAAEEALALDPANEDAAALKRDVG